jgi:hypothetical protein
MDPGYQPSSQPYPAVAEKVGYSGMTLVFTGIAALMAGIIIGVLVMMLGVPTEPATAAASADASSSAAPVDTAEPDATTPKPKIDPKAAAAAKKLAALKKKVKRSRVKKIDPECAKYFKTKLPVGYVFDGGQFVENEYVANASGCRAVAKAAKAPWFCCSR